MLAKFSIITLLLSCAQLGLASVPGPAQVVLAPAPMHAVNEAITTTLKNHADPVDALLSLEPERAAILAEARLLRIFGEEEPEWMTEGDKLKLRREGKKFMDITDYEEFYSQQVTAMAGKARKSWSRAWTTYCTNNSNLHPNKRRLEISS